MNKESHIRIEDCHVSNECEMIINSIVDSVDTNKKDVQLNISDMFSNCSKEDKKSLQQVLHHKIMMKYELADMTLETYVVHIDTDDYVAAEVRKYVSDFTGETDKTGDICVECMKSSPELNAKRLAEHSDRIDGAE